MFDFGELTKLIGKTYDNIVAVTTIILVSQRNVEVDITKFAIFDYKKDLKNEEYIKFICQMSNRKSRYNIRAYSRRS